MTRHSWCRNWDWDSRIESAFFAKLGRARNKAQYLRCQASILAKRHPTVALRLLDQYFSLGDHFDLAQAHVDRATAFLSLADIEHAIEAYEAALSVEERRPNISTQAYLDLPLLIATRRDKMRYGRALSLLEQGTSRLVFPVDHFRWHAANAFIDLALGRFDDAREHARAALNAASTENSGFHYHPRVGLVDGSYDGIRRELARAAST